jgi:hypothetical protein
MSDEERRGLEKSVETLEAALASLNQLEEKLMRRAPQRVSAKWT